MKLVGGRDLELWHQVQVEVSRRCGLSVHEQTPAPDLLAERVGPDDHVLEQPRSESLALVTIIDAKAGEKGDGPGVAAGSLPGSSRRVGELDAGPL